MICSAPSDAALVREFSATAEPNASPDADEAGAGSINLWSLDTGGAGAANAGSFLGNSGSNAGGSGAGAGASAWALYANGGATSTASASVSSLMGRALLAVGDSISLDFDNGWIDNGSSVGIRFRDNLGAVASSLSFTGGNATYQLSDGTSSNHDTTVGFTGDGFNVSLTLTSSSGDYSVQVGGTEVLGRMLDGAQNIASIEVFNSNAGGGAERDIFFNNLSLSAVPEASTTLAMPLLAGLLLRKGRGRRSQG